MCHIKKNKVQNHNIFSIDIEKTFEKYPVHIYDKNFQ